MTSQQPTTLQIASELSIVRRVLEEIKENAIRADDRAAEYRDKIFNKLEDVGTRTTILETHYVGVSNRLAQIEPIVTALHDMRNRAAGVILAIGVVGSILGAVVTNALVWIKGHG